MIESEKQPDGLRYRIGDLTFDPANRTFERDGVVSTLPKLSYQLLHCLVRHAPDTVDVDQLIQEVWGQTIVSPETLTQRVKLLRDAIGDDHNNPRFIETRRGHGYRLIPEVEPLTRPSRKRANNHRLLLASLGALLAVSAVIYLLNAGRLQEPGDTPPSIAVLPFVNMSADPNQEFFSEGISEELLNLLSKIPGLRVSARTSSFQFKGANLDVIEIGRQLNTGFVVEGSVRKSGSEVRITAQLVDASNGFHLWSESYDRELEDIFALQDEISTAIVAALKDRLGLSTYATPRARATDNIAAHEAYLRGRYLMAPNTRTSIEQAIEQFELALSLDPDYALAHAALAIAHIEMSRNPTATRKYAAPHVEQAMALQPDLAEAVAARGYLAWSQENWDDALKYFQQAVSINPNYVDVYVWMGNLLSWKLGRYAEAFEARKTAMRLDPLSIPTIVFYVQGLIARHRIDEARRELDKIATIFPHVYAYRIGTLESRGGNMASALFGSLEALRIEPGYAQVKIGMLFRFAELGLDQEIFLISATPHPLIYGQLGKPQEAIAAAEARLARDPDSVVARHDLGLALAAAGEYARARPILEDMWRLSGGVISNRSDIFSTLSAAALIAARRDAGDESGIGELIAAIHDNVRRYREAGIVGDGRSYGVDFEEGLALLLSGERERGLALLDKGTEDGVFLAPHEAYLQSLYDDPGFAPIRARQEARQARERQRFLAVVCNDNPYAAVWQPAEETCDLSTTAGSN